MNGYWWWVDFRFDEFACKCCLCFLYAIVAVAVCVRQRVSKGFSVSVCVHFIYLPMVNRLTSPTRLDS